jgi:hypothetical protein
VSAIRNASQLYDSGGLKPLELDPADSYVDLGDFARKLARQLPEPALVNATMAVTQALSSFVIYDAAQSGSFLYFDPAISAERSYSVSLKGATGLGVFYPPAASTDANSAYQAYVTNRLFDTTRDSGWNRWLGAGLADLGIGPVLKNGTLIPPLVASQAPPATHFVYLPLVER